MQPKCLNSNTILPICTTPLLFILPSWQVVCMTSRVTTWSASSSSAPASFAVRFSFYLFHCVEGCGHVVYAARPKHPPCSYNYFKNNDFFWHITHITFAWFKRLQNLCRYTFWQISMLLLQNRKSIFRLKVNIEYTALTYKSVRAYPWYIEGVVLCFISVCRCKN